MERLRDWIAAQGLGRLEDVTQISAGQSNPTYMVATSEGQFVLRRKPDGPLLPGAHLIEREYRVMGALAGTPVPVPGMRGFCEDAGVFGTPFYVMDRAPGVTLWDPALPGLPKDQRRAVHDAMIDVLAALHDVDVDAVGLGDFGKRGGYFARQLAIWSRQYDAAGGGIAEMDPLRAWLEANLPEDDSPVGLVHGDFRIDNMLWEGSRVTALLDWELATLGPAMADLAYLVMQRSMGRDWHLKGLEGLDCEAEGLPSEAEVVARYCAARGLPDWTALPDWHFSKVFAFYRFAAICHGVGARAAAGNNASPDAGAVGVMAPKLAALGLALIA